SGIGIAQWLARRSRPGEGAGIVKAEYASPLVACTNTRGDRRTQVRLRQHSRSDSCGYRARAVAHLLGFGFGRITGAPDRIKLRASTSPSVGKCRALVLFDQLPS